MELFVGDYESLLQYAEGKEFLLLMTVPNQQVQILSDKKLGF